MNGFARLAVLAVLLLMGGTSLAQERRGWFGAEVSDVSKEEAARLRWDTPHGAKVRAILAGSPAETAGLKAGDIILTLDRTEIENAADFEAAIEIKRPGTEVRLSVLSAGREVRLAATLAERPRELASDRDLPILQLDTGGHMSVIKGLTFTPDGRYIVSSGDDKVIRVWDWRAGTTVRSIRGQAEPGSQGKVYAMALSPDGRWLAAGGWMTGPGDSGHVVRLYDFGTGKLVALLKGHDNVAHRAAFAPDSKRLISGSADNTAIIWDVERHELARHLKGHTARVYAVGFSPDGTNAVTGSYDKTLKLWSVATGREIATLSGHKDRVYTLAVSSADGTIASGGVDGEIRLWDGRTGRFLRTLARQDSHVGMLRFSADGKQLLSTCGFGGCSDRPQRLWEVATGKELLAYGGHDNIVLAAAMSSDGLRVATAGGNSRQIDIWSAKTGKLERRLAGKGAPGWAAAVSPDGRRVAWGNTPGGASRRVDYRLEWQLRLPLAGGSLGLPERLDSEEAAKFLRARHTYGAYALAYRQGGVYGRADAILDVIRDGKVQASVTRGTSDGLRHTAYSFTPDGQSVISGGSNGRLIAYDLQGKELGQFIGHEGDLWSLAPSPDGRLLVTGSGDQTVRLWNIKTRELIVTLFRDSDGEWVMWTPQGYYTGSPGADKFVGWQINRGPENAADYVGADQLRAHLNRPDIVEKAIILASAEQAVRESAGTTFKLADLLAKPVPRFRVLSPAGGSTLSGRRVTVKIDVETVPNPLKAIRVQVNGRQVAEITPDTGSGGLKAGEHGLDVPLAKGRNEVRITLNNDSGDKTETLTLNHEGDGDLDKRGTLYLLAIGVDRYPKLGNTCGEFNNQSCDLRYSGADARRLVDAAERRLGPAHTKVVKRVLINGAGASEAPTARNIIDAIDLLKDAQETDTILLFVAGHGVNDGPSYRFLATDAERAGASFRGVSVVPWQVLQEAVEAAKGRRLLFLDTCHSGNAYNQKLGNAAYHANIITYTSARFDQEAMEDEKLGHGLFTYAVVEGLEGKGEFATKREISTQDLALFVVKRVDQLAKALRGAQEPQYYKGRDAQDYVLVVHAR